MPNNLFACYESQLNDCIVHPSVVSARNAIKNHYLDKGYGNVNVTLKPSILSGLHFSCWIRVQSTNNCYIAACVKLHIRCD